MGICWYYYLCWEEKSHQRKVRGSIQSCDLGIASFSSKWQRICQNQKDRAVISMLTIVTLLAEKEALDLRNLQVWGCTSYQEDTVWTYYAQELKVILFFFDYAGNITAEKFLCIKVTYRDTWGTSCLCRHARFRIPHCPITQHANTDLHNFLKRAGGSVYALFHLYITVSLLFGPLPTINTRDYLLFFSLEVHAFRFNLKERSKHQLVPLLHEHVSNRL